MDYIKKTICLEGARSRTQGLMPYYEIGAAYPDVSGGSCYTMEELGLSEASGGNGNWGQIVANPCFLAECGKTYNDMLLAYYTLLNMVRSGIKLRKVERKEDEGGIIYTQDINSFYLSGTCLTGGDEPDSLYDYAAYDAVDFYSTEIVTERNELRNVYRYSGTGSPEDMFIVLIEDMDKFNGLAGYLRDTEYFEALSELNPENIYGEEDGFVWARFCKVVDLCIGKLDVPASIYNEHIKVPKSMPCADVADYIEWLLNNQDLSGNCCNARLWDDMGGEDMLEFLIENSGVCENSRAVLNSLKYAVPYIEIPLLITQNFTDVGVLTNIDGVEYEKELPGPSSDDGNEITRPHGKFQIGNSGFTSGSEINYVVGSGVGVTLDEIIMGSSRKTYPTTDENEQLAIEVESLARTLRSSKKYFDDKDNILPGLFQKFEDEPAGKYFIATSGTNGWVIEEYDGETSGWTNADGKSSEELSGVTPMYRNVTTKESARRIAEVYGDEPKEYGTVEIDKFYFKVKYDNSEDSPMTVPYLSGNVTNTYLIESGDTGDDFIYRGDFILSADTREISGQTYFEITYVIGGYYSADSGGTFIDYIGSGDVYYEKHIYDDKHVDYAVIDGVDNVPVYSQYVDFEADMKEFYSPRYNLYRMGNTANIIEMTTGEIWNEDDAYDAYLTKEEYLINFSLPPKTDVNVTIDRGGVSAFEKHYKLSECNTMSDLINYGNNFFNL